MIVESKPISNFVEFAKDTNFNKNNQEYISKLLKLIKDHESLISCVRTEYTINKTEVLFYDIKLKFSHKEDDIIQKMYKTWNKLEKTEVPFRRGMCIGRVSSTSFVAVGTIKFFYGTYEEFSKNDDIFITEKANGEFTMFTTIRVNEYEKWILVGSKNVRIVLPITDGVSSKQPITYYKELMDQVNEDMVGRYAYLETMIGLWYEQIIYDSQFFILSENYTMIGEQIGVHAHIFTDYKPSIAIFGLIDKKTHSIDSHVYDLDKLIVDSKKFLRTVKVQKMEKENLLDSLSDIATGSIEEYGEGSVVYCKKDGVVSVYKYKNDSYSYIRAIRTKMESFIGRINKDPSIVQNTPGEIQFMVSRIKRDDRFPDTPQDVVSSWLAIVPRMIIYIVKHRLTFITSDFPEHFIRIYEYLIENPDKYHGPEDIFQQKMDEIIKLPVESQVRPINDIVEDLAKEIISFKPHIFMFSMRPCSGKSVLLKLLRKRLIGPQGGFRNIRVFERDQLTMRYNDHAIINKHWYNNVRKFINHEPGNLAFVGNCFANDFAIKFRQELGKKSKRRMLVARLSDTEIGHPDYVITCLKRLSERVEDNTDESTLNIDLGAYIVCNKFFMTNPIQAKHVQGSDMGMVVFNTMDLVDKVSDSVIKKINKFRDLFVVRQGSLRTRMVFSGKKPILLGLYPIEKDSMFKLFELGSESLEKSDMHITLKFKATEEDLKEYKIQTTYLITCKELVTIKKDFNGITEMLQFIPVDNKYANDPTIHMTLGTTNNQLLPCRLSGEYLKERNSKEFLGNSVPEPVAFSDYEIIKENIDPPIQFKAEPRLFY